MYFLLQDPKLLAALQESRRRQAPYAGAFLVKDEPGTDPSTGAGSETEKNVLELKGKELFNRLYEVGTLAQVYIYVALQFFLNYSLITLEFYMSLNRKSKSKKLLM